MQMTKQEIHDQKAVGYCMFCDGLILSQLPQDDSQHSAATRVGWRRAKTDKERARQLGQKWTPRVVQAGQAGQAEDSSSAEMAPNDILAVPN